MIIPEQLLADTRSRKMICAYDTDDLTYVREQTTNHDIHDRFDCLCVFEAEMLAALRLYGEASKEYDRARMMYLFNLYFFSDETMGAEMTSLGLVTSIDRVAFGKSLLKHFLQK